jgi:NAD(P)-dependent dehydrogenase (short-subunit alcohol dehydrogenase family)
LQHHATAKNTQYGRCATLRRKAGCPWRSTATATPASPGVSSGTSPSCWRPRGPITSSPTVPHPPPFKGLVTLDGSNNTSGPPAGTFDDFDDEGWQAGFELVLLSLIRAVRGALPLMRERGGGRIVNIASSSIKQPIENLILSNTFRAAISGLAKSLAIELAPDGILVNTIGPGRISTARYQSMNERNAEAAGVTVEEVRGRVEAQIPLGRYGTPEEFARVVAFFASPANT